MKNISSHLYHRIAQHMEDEPQRIICRNISQRYYIEFYYFMEDELGEVITTHVFEKVDERIFVNE